MTNNNADGAPLDGALVLAIDIGTTSLKAAFVSAAGEVFDFKRIEYKANGSRNKFGMTGGETCHAELVSASISDDGQNCAASWTAALRNFFPSQFAGRCVAAAVSGNGPTIVAADGTALMWNDDVLSSSRPVSCALFSKFPVPDEQKKIYEPRLAAFKELFPDSWEQSPRLYTPSSWLCAWIQQNAAALGLEPNLPVFDAGPDFVAALVGTGTLSPGRLCDRAGSSEGLNLCSPKFFEAPNLRTMPSPARGLWNVSCLLPDPGSSQDEKLDNFKAAFLALKSAAAEHGVPFDGEVVVTGGQARDKDLLAAKAQVSGATLATAQIPDAELLGNAAAAFFRLGKYSSLEEAASKIVRVGGQSQSGEPCHCRARPDNLFGQKIPASSAGMTDGDSSVSGGAFPRLYSVPQDLRAILFDIDSTLYTNAAYAFEQVDCQARRFASMRGISNEEARKMIADYRKKYAAENGGKKVSLSNTLAQFGVSIEQSVQWRRELIEPADFLGPDEELQKTLAALGRRYKLLCVTNNPVLPARKTLDALGVTDFFEVLVGLDTCNLSKPAKEPFERAASEAGVPFDKIISVGDRYDLDIAPALELGMGGVLVRGVEDVYKLPELF